MDRGEAVEIYYWRGDISNMNLTTLVVYKIISTGGDDRGNGYPPYSLFLLIEKASGSSGFSI